jgi:multiple sugar transport system substrate-binding protein
MGKGRHTSALTLMLILLCACEKTPPPQKNLPPSAFSFHKQPTSAIIFLSTQMNPVEEAAKMRNLLLKGFPGKIDFKPNDSSYIFSQIGSLLKANPSEAILIGAVHGDMVTLYEKQGLIPLNSAFSNLGDRVFSKTLLKMCRLNGKDIFYIPWMQASFVMVVNRKALKYLPTGCSLDTLTYEDLYRWAKSIYEKTGKKAIGFPAGRNGLMHRFLQGYLYPSFTSSTLLKFRSPEAWFMWGYMKALWNYVHPSSLVYSNMAEPLLTGDIWIAWDHTARLLKALEKQPRDFIAFPAPIGPKGRGFIPVVSGLAIPKGVTDVSAPGVLIDYLTQPDIQAQVFRDTGFFPAVTLATENGLPEGLKNLKSAVDKQSDSLQAIPTLLPIGLSERGSDYNDLFMFTFSEIVLEGKNTQAVLDANAKDLQQILDEQNVKSWLPDVSKERPCKIE